MPNDFLAQFQAGFQMGQSRNENARRNQELMMEQQRQQQMQEQRAAAFTLQQEEFALRKKQLAAEEHAHKLNAAKEAFQQRMEANQLQNMPPPTAADVGIPEQGPEMAGPMASQVNVPQPTMAMPSAMQGQPDIQMPVPTGRQQQDMAAAEQQRKMREALGMLIAKEQATQKSPEQIQAEAYARARGERMGNPPQPREEPQGSWSEAVGPDGKPILLNQTTGATKPFPAGVSPKAKAPRPATSVQSRALKFWERGRDALANLEKPISKAPNAPTLEDSIAKSGAASQWWMRTGPNVTLTPEQRRYNQAAQSFTEARLRQDSGAAIPPYEFESDMKMYFVQPGDDPATIEQKRLSRLSVLDALKGEAGPAWEENYGQPAPVAPPRNGGIDPEVERAIQEARDKGLI
jgi:hypothetical protein